jgi:hypothetical protein
MYTGIRVRFLDSERFRFEGHAYDISEGGVQFELDHPIEPGTPIVVEIDLPEGKGGEYSVPLIGNVVWTDDSEPGPVRMAMAITRFLRSGDKERLLFHAAHTQLRRAA